MPPENERRPGEEAPRDWSGAGERADIRIVATDPYDASGNMPSADIESFINLIHPGGLAGKIEVRLFAEQPPKSILGREWFDSARELATALPRLNQRAEQLGASVCFGVLPRRSTDSGRSVDTIDGMAAWVDIDFKDFEGGEDEARQRLGEFLLPPSAVVRSGHGLHCYWLIEQPTPPATLSQISKRLAKVLGGDHAYDPARLLRLPDTTNRKDPDHLVQVEIEAMDPERQYTVESIDLVLDEIAGPASAETEIEPADTPEFEVPRDLPPRIRELIDQDARIANLFVGKGKPEKGNDGKPLDRSSSGYDHSLILALTKAGVVEPGELAAALWCRPDGKAREKGAGYIRRTVHGVLESLAKELAEMLEAQVDFKIDGLKVYHCRPALYEFTIGGHTIRLTSGQLRSASQFTTAFLDTLHRIPRVPTKREEWSELVNAWLAKAEHVGLPPEASDEEALREDIQRVVSDLPVGEERADLDHGKALVLEGNRTVFKAATILRMLREEHPQLGRNVLCQVLRDLGFHSEVERIEEQGTRVWVWNTVTPSNAREGEVDISEKL